MEKVLELNQILDKEIEFCENFEKNVKKYAGTHLAAKLRRGFKKFL